MPPTPPTPLAEPLLNVIGVADVHNIDTKCRGKCRAGTTMRQSREDRERERWRRAEKSREKQTEFGTGRGIEEER